MKAIILAAGKGTRLLPLTLETPKAMVEVFGKTLLEYNMERLLPYVDEFIIVVKYKKEAITEYFGNEYNGVPISYHEQGGEKGTGAAVKGIQASGDIVIAYADAIISEQDVHTVMQNRDYAVLVKEVENPQKYGIFAADEQGYATKIIEKPQEYVGNLANFSFFKVNDSLLQCVNNISLSPRGELEITDAINLFVKDHKLKLIHLQNDIVDVTSLEDLKNANTLQKPQLGETQYLEKIGEYELHLGIPKSGIEEIVAYTLDPNDIALQKGTSDAVKRFISIENLTSWYNDNERYTFTLLSKQGVVAGLWWGRPASLPNITKTINSELLEEILSNKQKIHTSGIRIYPLARGQRLAKPFLSACSRYYETLFPDGYMCIDIDEENIPSQKSFEKSGFQKLGHGKNVNNSPESGRQRFVYVRSHKKT